MIALIDRLKAPGIPINLEHLKIQPTSDEA